MIGENVRAILEELPEGVQLVGAAKTRQADEIIEAIDAGLGIIGENYVQEAEKVYKMIGSRVNWHMIGHLQTNKAKKAVQLFDMIETIDSAKLARAIHKECVKIGEVMPVLIEVNSGEESQKAGVLPKDIPALIRDMAELDHIELQGLMTMGPLSDDPEEARPFFQRTRALYDQFKEEGIPRGKMTYLSMGMSGSYRVAIEEGANLVRIGTKIFGERGST
jgi:pyridoxal phosphate enzyme (YggS family)